VLDVVALGDAMVGFAPPGCLRLEQGTSVEVWPTGAEANAVVTRTEVADRLASGDQEIQR
jgi:hypothetical protein